MNSSAPDEPGQTAQPTVLGSLQTPTSLRMRATEALREALIVGELTPGKVYSAPALADQLGVSATPVREAMMELAGEGYVEALRHRGYRVVEFSVDTLSQITAVRRLLEVPIVGQVAETATAEDVAALRPLADQIVATAEAGALRAFISADTQFHLQLLGLSGNQVLVDQVRRLRGMTRLHGLEDVEHTGQLNDWAQEHHQLLDALQNHDAATARALMEQHLGHVDYFSESDHTT